MNATHHISDENLSLDKIPEILDGQLALSPSAKDRVNACRAYLDGKLAASDQPYYGINTGFGDLHSVKIPGKDMGNLQTNLVISHACGTGDEVPPEIVKLMLLLKIQSLAYGHSGVQLQTIERLIGFYNHDIMPVVYEIGSLGASGDLAPLAHLSLPLIGRGQVNHGNNKVAAAEVLKQFNWQPIELRSKEGLALLNGTQFMGAYGVACLWKARQLIRLANRIGAMSLDAFDCRLEPFEPPIHRIRPHQGQVDTAAEIMELLAGSEIARKPKDQVQDPYSFRCIPQVHGASQKVIDHTHEVFQTEINSVTDNPNIFPEEDLILSGGNFHGQPLALALDYLAIAVAELGSISERRIYKLVAGERGLPPFLIKDSGLNSGLMIPQYTAAALVSQNKQFCTPASVDSITSSNGQEDHVSMGANAATKAWKVIDNVERILAIELLNAAQALEFRRPLRSSPKLEEWLTAYRQIVPFYDKDRILFDDMEQTITFLAER